MGKPANWTDDGTTLTAPNGNTVTGSLRDFVLNRNPEWPSALVPLRNAVEIDGVTGNSTQLFGLGLTLVKENNSLVENNGDVPAAQTASKQALTDGITALSQVALQLQQILSNINSLLATLESTSGAS